jgi:2-keto-3-deoxy-L-rhamnonate aldolase RhmA
MAEGPRGIVRNNVKEKLARGEVVASMTVRLMRSVEIARLAKTAGFDSIYVDVEHSSLSLETTSQICITALEVGIAPFVRVPSTRPEHVSRALDGGALGVIAPTSARGAKKARPSPPRNIRRWGTLRGAAPPPALPPFPAAGRTPRGEGATMVVVVRDRRRHQRADEIATIEGVDWLMGTNDLPRRHGAGGPVRARARARRLRPHPRRLPGAQGTRRWAAATRRSPVEFA